jgi:hypothetical protein
MVQVFERAITRRLFADDEFMMMREAYLVALDTLKLTDEAERRQVALIVQNLARLERFPGASYLADLAIDWYRSGRPVD